MPSNLPIDGHSFRRVEVQTGTPRRRRWSDDEKAAIVAESQSPGAQASEIALRYGLHRNQLYGWRRELRVASSRFAAVRIAPDTAQAGLSGAGTIEIEFATGARMRITGAVDAATLTAALTVLAEGRRR